MYLAIRYVDYNQLNILKSSFNKLIAIIIVFNVTNSDTTFYVYPKITRISVVNNCTIGYLRVM